MSKALQLYKKELEGDAFRSAVSAILPKVLTPERFVRIGILAMSRTPLLAECSRSSVFQSLMTLASIGLEPDGRHAHLIPFRNSKTGAHECTLILDYKGLVALAMRSGQVLSIHADVVRDADEFEYNIGQVTAHRINYKQPRGKVYAAYCIIRMRDCDPKCEVMSVEEIEAVRSRSKAAKSGPWVTDWAEMAKKTVFKRASKWLPLSPEQRDAIESDEQVAVAPVVDVPDFSFLQASDPASAPARQPGPTEPDPFAALDQGDEAPQPEAAPEVPAAPAPAPAPPKESVPAAPPVKQQLEELVIKAGYTFDEFRQYLGESGIVEDADSLTGFGDIHHKTAAMLLKGQRGMMMGLNNMHGPRASSKED